jgi:hypothetical protein
MLASIDYLIYLFIIYFKFVLIYFHVLLVFMLFSGLDAPNKSEPTSSPLKFLQSITSNPVQKTKKASLTEYVSLRIILFCSDFRS